MFYTTPTDDGAIAVTCDRCLRRSAAPTPVRRPPPSPTTTATPTPPCPLQRTAAPRSTTSSRRRCTCWPACGSPPARPAGSSWPAPQARPAASGAPPAPRCPVCDEVACMSRADRSIETQAPRRQHLAGARRSGAERSARDGRPGRGAVSAAGLTLSAIGQATAPRSPLRPAPVRHRRLVPRRLAAAATWSARRLPAVAGWARRDRGADPGPGRPATANGSPPSTTEVCHELSQ